MNILTFDVEEWFHILDNESTQTMNEWGNYEVRIHANMERIFTILERNNQKATFFCLGWIAETYPQIIRQIVDRGYEIGSHTRMHQLVYDQKPKDFKKDIESSIKSLEDISGKKIKYFRAPGFSIREDTKWAFDILVELGIEVDSSILPALGTHGGFPLYKDPVPSILRYNGINLKEFPIACTSIMGRNLIFSGGGYFRLFPYKLIKHWTDQRDYVMCYIHPRDFDINQPIIKELSLYRRWKSRVGLKLAAGKFEQWIQDYEFIDIGSAIETINWDKVPIVKI